MKCILPFALYLLPFTLTAQTITQKLQKAFTTFEKDEQLKHAISSLYVIDAKTGQVVFDKNSQIGLAPASTQKIITSVTAFELLGRGYRYKTTFHSEKPNKNLVGHLIMIKGSADPTFGSWRFTSTTPQIIFNSLKNLLLEKGIKMNETIFFVDKSRFENKNIPDKWMWEDIGNYYGAGASDINWKENQIELRLSAGDKIGDRVVIKTNYDSLFKSSSMSIDNRLTSGSIGSGDNAYHYFSYGNSIRLVPSILKGTIPIKEKNFPISIAVAEPYDYFESDLNYFQGEIKNNPILATGDAEVVRNWFDSIIASTSSPIYTHYSPSLDSIIYWFNKKSINLYGEALIKTFAYEKQGFGSTDSGVAIVKKFWKSKGLDEDELNIYDGSGLSPMNRVTTHAQVEILKYAKTKEWYPYFLKSLPDYNGMTMKSGTIGDVKGFCGYHKAKDGKEYIFSFLVNNYSGKTSGVVGKMYKVLDEMK